MRSLLDANDDWIERLRLYLYPKLHSTLTRFGGYAIGGIGERQYVGTVQIGEEAFEEELCDMGFRRNWLAALKCNGGARGEKRWSEGSWRLVREHDPRDDEVPERAACKLAPARQLHVTLFGNRLNSDWVDVYAHEELRPETDPGGHLDGDTFSSEHGVAGAGWLIDNESFVVLCDTDGSSLLAE